jgi:hypothetical protein
LTKTTPATKSAKMPSVFSVVPPPAITNPPGVGSSGKWHFCQSGDAPAGLPHGAGAGYKR